MRLFSHFREEEQRVEKLVCVGSADEEDRTIFRDVKSAPRSDFPEEDVYDESPEDKDKVV